VPGRVSVPAILVLVLVGNKEGSMSLVLLPKATGQAMVSDLDLTRVTCGTDQWWGLVQVCNAEGVSL